MYVSGLQEYIYLRVNSCRALCNSVHIDRFYIVLLYIVSIAHLDEKIENFKIDRL